MAYLALLRHGPCADRLRAARSAAALRSPRRRDGQQGHGVVALYSERRWLLGLLPAPDAPRDRLRAAVGQPLAAAWAHARPCDDRARPVLCDRAARRRAAAIMD